MSSIYISLKNKTLAGQAHGRGSNISDDAANRVLTAVFATAPSGQKLQIAITRWANWKLLTYM